MIDLNGKTYEHYVQYVQISILREIAEDLASGRLDMDEGRDIIADIIANTYDTGYHFGRESMPKVEPIPHKKAQMTGRELTIWRKKKGWNQSELGKKLGRSGRSVRRFEDSKHIPIWVFNKTETM